LRNGGTAMHPGAAAARSTRARASRCMLGHRTVTSLSTMPVLKLSDLKKHFPVHRGVLSRVVGQVLAVDGVSFEIAAGETLCLVGESGCGKSTVARTVMRLLEPTAGTVTLNGVDISRLSEAQLRPYRRQMQMVF